MGLAEICVMIAPTCRECGQPFTPGRRDAVFCSTSCRSAYNNRRQQRGAEFYDLVMEMRFDRRRASATKAWSVLCSVAGRFREEDNDQRSGRPSWSETTRLARINSRLGR